MSAGTKNACRTGEQPEGNRLPCFKMRNSSCLCAPKLLVYNPELGHSGHLFSIGLFLFLHLADAFIQSDLQMRI